MLMLTYLSYLVGGGRRFLLFHIERVPDPLSLLPEKDRMGLLLHNPNRASLLCFHHRKARVFRNSERDE